MPDLEKGGEPAELLLDLYLKNGKWDEASALSLRIFSSDEKNFSATQKVTQALLEEGQGERAMSLLSRIRIPMIDAGEHEGVAHLLTELADAPSRQAGAPGVAGRNIWPYQRLIPFAGRSRPSG